MSYFPPQSISTPQLSEFSTHRSSLIPPSPLAMHPPSSQLSPNFDSASSALSTPTLADDTALPIELQTLCVIGGGTGCNAILGAFARAKKISYIVPISDDGGSSSEIQRVLGQSEHLFRSTKPIGYSCRIGMDNANAIPPTSTLLDHPCCIIVGGPSVGDIRSRLVRLIPTSSPSSPLFAIRRLLEHRLGDQDSAQVKAEWHSIVEGKHWLWQGIPNDRKETIRAFLIHVEAQILRRARRGFSYKRASIGNLFVAGAQLFLGSIPSAIFLFASITDIPHDTIRVVPVINTSSTATIAAELENGTIIPGQSEISHPSSVSHSLPPRCPTPSLLSPSPIRIPPSPGAAISHPLNISRVPTPALLFEARTLGAEEDDDDDVEEGNPNVGFSKDVNEIPELEARIKRVFYLNAYGSEIYPRANPLFIDGLKESSCLVYSPGSLYTSIVPCLALRLIGSSIATSHSLRYKILLLNSTLDRETPSYSAMDFVRAIKEACNEVYGEEVFGHSSSGGREWSERDLITHLVYVQGGQVEVEKQELQAMGIKCIPVLTENGMFDEVVVANALEIIFAEDGRE